MNNPEFTFTPDFQQLALLGKAQSKDTNHFTLEGTDMPSRVVPIP
jgi:hypothetical protein